MSEYLGRKVSASIDGTTVINGRTTNLSINNEIIDITANGDDGIQRSLSEPGQKAVELTIDGLAIDDELLDKALSNDLSAAVIMTFPAEAGAGAFTLTGSFMMPSYSIGAPYNEAATISASFSSTGAIVKAAV